MRTDTPTARGSSAVWRALRDELARVGTAEPHVVDVGGGSGVWAVPLAAAGCRVTVVEPNPNALATLRRRAEETGVAARIAVVADDTDALGGRIPAGSADLVLAHGLLEVVDDPVAVVAALAGTATPGRAVSVLAANRHAAVLHRALAGRLGEARRLLAAADGVLADDSENLLRRFDTEGLTALLASAGLVVELVQGDGVVSDSVGEAESELFTGEELAEFEGAAGVVPPLRDIATRLHVLGRRPR
ncbi:MAG TPA: methyltransferase domain-containing protein [Amycolatopsis sp.]|uniref:methyltransferase domain-containing protein n=1 Tax=Amycolatopsis sp. TaxID=37632 RepID=UPI002B4A2AEA|nr:methyltransferase domain-containing protein [Amycolatopsis sp.]HKS49553.1 methyltransferase domain-containing protein [Amycolatopsis sp.]